MESKLSEVYCYYKQQYPNQIIILHAGNIYKVCFEDGLAPLVSFNSINLCKSDDGTYFNVGDVFEDRIESCASDIRKDGIPFRLIEYVNQNGEHSFPDIDQLITDKDEDY